MKPKNPFIIISKTLFFPKQKILAVGDLHIGYEQMLRLQGIFLPFNQLKTTKEELNNIIKHVKTKYGLNKIILLGDIKHHFSFEKSEIFELRDFMKFLEKQIPKEKIILIKGNHDTFTLKDHKIQESYVEDSLAFFHGDKIPKNVYENSKIKTCIISHIHPSVNLRDKTGIKREKFKAFFIGKFKRKELIVIPSFLPLIEGSEINEFHNQKNFSIIDNSKLKKFDVYLVGKQKVYGFGKFKDLMK